MPARQTSRRHPVKTRPLTPRRPEHGTFPQIDKPAIRLNAILILVDDGINKCGHKRTARSAEKTNAQCCAL